MSNEYMQVKLSVRLMQIAEQLPYGCKLADIGSDHALLPVYAVQSGKAVSAIIGELNEGPFQAARQQVERSGVQALLSVRKGDGLSVLSAGEADVVTIAGMGGSNIVHILSGGSEVLAEVHRLVLQPNVAEDAVRCWLTQNGWNLISETIVEEDGLYYEIMTADKGSTNDANPDLYQKLTLPCGLILDKEDLLRFGPLQLRHPNAHFVTKWKSERSKLLKIANQIAESSNPEALLRKEEMLRSAKRIEEVLECLPMDKP